jgi:hypothetical protein
MTRTPRGVYAPPAPPRRPPLLSVVVSFRNEEEVLGGQRDDDADVGADGAGSVYWPGRMNALVGARFGQFRQPIPGQ